jgi:NAD(P)-dependent dehydrogenase (short-subunit alcohol dehydrogenase family)
MLGTILITGGASGLGAAIATAVEQEGGTPVVLDRRPPPNGFAFRQVDLADARAAEDAVRAVADEHGGLDASSRRRAPTPAARSSTSIPPPGTA